MKYLANHYQDFINPKTAFAIGIMQCFGGLAAEILCIVYLTSITNTMDTVIKFMALASIAKVDDWYAGALQPDYILKKKVKMPVRNFKKNIASNSEHKNCLFMVLRFIYKTIRIFYCSWMYYFMPFTCIVIPYLTNSNCDATSLQDYIDRHYGTDEHVVQDVVNGFSISYW